MCPAITVSQKLVAAKGECLKHRIQFSFMLAYWKCGQRQHVSLEFALIARQFGQKLVEHVHVECARANGSPEDAPRTDIEHKDTRGLNAPLYKIGRAHV